MVSYLRPIDTGGPMEIRMNDRSGDTVDDHKPFTYNGISLSFTLTPAEQAVRDFLELVAEAVHPRIQVFYEGGALLGNVFQRELDELKTQHGITTPAQLRAFFQRKGAEILAGK